MKMEVYLTQCTSCLLLILILSHVSLVSLIQWLLGGMLNAVSCSLQAQTDETTTTAAAEGKGREMNAGYSMV